jgi:hypothetical protein
MIETANTSETLRNSHQTTRRCNPEDRHLPTHSPANHSSWMLKLIYVKVLTEMKKARILRTVLIWRRMIHCPQFWALCFSYKISKISDILTKCNSIVTCIYKIRILHIKLKCGRVYVRLRLKNGYTNLHQTWHAYSLKPDGNFRKVSTLKNCSEFKSQ